MRFTPSSEEFDPDVLDNGSMTPSASQQPARFRRAAWRAAEVFTSPVPPQEFARLFNPLVSSRQLRGVVTAVRVDGVATPVGVAEGQVEVTTPGGRAGLRAGETLVREQASRVTTERSDVARMMAWREGRLVFSGQPLSVVLAELERYRRGRIVSLDPTVGTRRFSGTLDPRDTDEALAVLATTMDVRITRVTPLLVLVRPGS